MQSDLQRLTDFLLDLAIDKVAHTQRSYLAHVVGVYKLMQAWGQDEELCRAGLFHSIYGTERFQGFKLPLVRRHEVQALIGPRAERLAYWNCLMDRGSLDALLGHDQEPFPVRNRETQETWELTRGEYDDLCRVHLFDWLEQAPRSSFGWDYRRDSYRRMAERLGGRTQEAYLQVFATEPAAPR